MLTLRYFTYCTFLSAFLLISGGHRLCAQERQPLQGRVITDTSITASVNIVNISAQTATISQPNGHFSIPVKRGDSLRFSSLSYHPVTLRVTKATLAKDSLTIQLEKAVNELGTVHLNSGLSGDLGEDAEEVGYFNQAEIGFKITHQPMTAPERRLNYVTAGNNITQLANAISGRTKMLRRQLGYQNLESKKQLVVTIVGLDFFTKKLKIPAKDVDRFLYFCLSKAGFPKVVSPSQILALRQFLAQKAPAYKAAWKAKKTD